MKQKYLGLGLIIAITLSLASCDWFTGATGATGADGEDATTSPYWFTPTSAYSRAVCYGGGTIVCAGDSGLAGYKVSGGDWQLVEISGSPTMNAIAYGNGTFVAVGNSGAIYFSSDGGANWTKAASSGASNFYNLIDIAYGDGLFVAAGNNGDNAGNLIYSADGNTWNSYTFLADYPVFTSIDFANGSFFTGVASTATLYSSADGQGDAGWTSTAISISISLSGFMVAYGNGMYLLLDAGGGDMETSSDGTTWTMIDSVDPSPTYTGLVYDGERFVLLKTYGELYSTPDGATWSIHPTLPNSTYSYVDLVWASDIGEGTYLFARYQAN